MSTPRRRRVTAQDVADLAGVSRNAVSRAFNGGYRLRSSTVDRIMEAADQLGWRPNTAARAIKGSPAHTIGFILRREPDLLGADPFFPLFLAGLERVLSEQAYALTIRFVSDETEEELCYRDWRAERSVDAFIVADLRDADPRFALLDELGASAIVIGDPPPGVEIPAVFHDSDDSIRHALDGWIARGHIRIGHVMGDPALEHARRRRDIWAGVLERHGLRSDLLAVGGFTESGAEDATREILAVDEPPTAVFYANDVMAAAGMRTIAEAGLRVGEQVAVFGFDGIPLAPYLSPPLATIACDYVELGEIAGRMLLAGLEAETVGPVRRTLPARFVQRASYGIGPQR
ncbi:MULTISPECIES: LacI family DNA-binding transcriptional regulator [Microbacterium]|uniref:LacI family transcriptional regulator n=1 Tax=Microbacterium wangchenii TaxID=2541726 RepID=A0ABX5SU43_9MICO|nr:MULTISPECIES: LacI family DNA-binding transcriptional regulator [Microbacterium]MCK6064900.1 LacI family transcriptional regulator [Microbacterium sp. EYE_512]QBR88384.1 LacI family transcriptional regulator [Microbacterium wangchenii]TFV82565.1 LacI family transcriptional regulator [Microbacterium sp. dk485]TXK20110.1 LacI family transcriptional regulator [Microbacterium wangchenii]